jgi:microcystin-dependent protein
MKRLRHFLIVLICLAVPYSATATVLHDIGCHHSPDGAMTMTQQDVAMPAHHHMSNQDHTQQKSAAHGGDCAAKCSCQYHCTAGNCATSTALALPATPADGGELNDNYLQILPDFHAGVLFRPPITALS